MRILVLLLAASALWAADDFSFFELLAPSSHSFAVVDDKTVTREGASYFYAPVREGSVSSNERAIDLATGKPLEVARIDGKSAKAAGGAAPRTADDARYLRVKLPGPVPKGAETRIRVYQTFTAPAFYYESDGGFVFDGTLGIKRIVALLPKGYELIGAASPAMVSTGADGRIRVSFLNDRDDQLRVHIVGRKAK
jgi:hypothetical protein